MSYNTKKLQSKKVIDRVKGGYADHIPDKYFHQNDLIDGIDIEMEHTDNPAIAKEITKDHLVETGFFDGEHFNSKYYPKLKKMERELEKAIKKKHKR